MSLPEIMRRTIDNNRYYIIVSQIGGNNEANIPARVTTFAVYRHGSELYQVSYHRATKELSYLRRKPKVKMNKTLKQYLEALLRDLDEQGWIYSPETRNFPEELKELLETGSKYWAGLYSRRHAR